MKKDLDDWLLNHKRKNHKTILPKSNTKNENIINLLMKAEELIITGILAIPFLFGAAMIVGFAYFAPPEVTMATGAILWTVSIMIFISRD